MPEKICIIALMCICTENKCIILTSHTLGHMCIYIYMHTYVQISIYTNVCIVSTWHILPLKQFLIKTTYNTIALTWMYTNFVYEIIKNTFHFAFTFNLFLVFVMYARLLLGNSVLATYHVTAIVMSLLLPRNWNTWLPKLKKTTLVLFQIWLQ